PGDHLDHALLVLEHEGRVAVALLAVLETQRVDDAAQLDARAGVGPAVALAVARRQLAAARAQRPRGGGGELAQVLLVAVEGMAGNEEADRDRKSTRLNSSHLGISYAVF